MNDNRKIGQQFGKMVNSIGDQNYQNNLHTGVANTHSTIKRAKNRVKDMAAEWSTMFIENSRSTLTQHSPCQNSIQKLVSTAISVQFAK